ncbi:hypothetical protein DL771_002329 [Monosporascus sp. 5C6A]|nr:hypothetical protein DL771_002329 [Monosporascus sp. 5C6A]
MTFPFEVKEHAIPAQHLREWPRATAGSQEDVLQIHIKQYKPLDNPDPQPGDVTIIGVGANGFPKEVYEALWADLHTQSTSHSHGFRIRSIWAADPANQGYSGRLNWGLLGSDPSGYDDARDLLHMVNHFRDQMPRPIVGFGHLYGGSVLAQLSLLHNRLFTSLVMLDACINVFSPEVQTGVVNAARMSAVRRDVWPSRDAAENAFRRSRFHKAWDPRVLEAWLAHGIRENTSGEPGAEDGGGGSRAELTTSRHQELFTFLRPLYPHIRPDGTLNRDGAPDFDSSLIMSENAVAD